MTTNWLIAANGLVCLKKVQLIPKLLLKNRGVADLEYCAFKAVFRTPD